MSATMTDREGWEGGYKEGITPFCYKCHGDASCGRCGGSYTDHYTIDHERAMSIPDLACRIGSTPDPDALDILTGKRFAPEPDAAPQEK